jgi:3-isopropylmalate dehydrogenase
MAGDELCCAQAQHGSAPDIQGQDKANPVSMILSVAMLLDWLGERRNGAALRQAAQAIEIAVDATLESPANRTADLGGTLGCQAFGQQVAAAL